MIDLINASSEKCCLPDISCMDESAPVFSLIYLVEERRGGDEDENKIYIKMVNHDFEFITMNNGVLEGSRKMEKITQMKYYDNNTVSFSTTTLQFISKWIS